MSSVRALGALAGVLIALVAFLWPRASAYPAVVEENLSLKIRLQAIETQMDEVDRITERLRLYDAQLRSLTEADGGHGPVPDLGEMSQGGILEYYADVEADIMEAPGLLSGADGGTDAEFLGAEDLLPAGSWATSVAERVDDFVDLFQLSESELAALMADLETLGAIQRALPQRWPAEGRLTSGFGWRRDPLRRYTKFHSGLDIANGTGTRLVAVADGIVRSSRWQNGYGNVVEIDHGFGITTRYAHCQRRRVSAGDRVQAGQFVATMGTTGRSTGPHLHFELRIDGSAQDPLKYLPR